MSALFRTGPRGVQIRDRNHLPSLTLQRGWDAFTRVRSVGETNESNINRGVASRSRASQPCGIQIDSHVQAEQRGTTKLYAASR